MPKAKYQVSLPATTPGGYGGSHQFYSAKERDEFLRRMQARGIAPVGVVSTVRGKVKA